MSSDKERLQTAQWVLERNLAWIAAAEVKVGVIVAIDTAMLGGAGCYVQRCRWGRPNTLGMAVCHRGSHLVGQRFILRCEGRAATRQWTSKIAIVLRTRWPLC